MNKKIKIIFFSILSVVLLSIFMRELIIKKEVDAVVDKIIEKIPESSRAGNPNMDVLRGLLRGLKRVYLDYSYEQLLELLDTIEEDYEYYELLEQGMSRFTYPVIAGAVILAAACGGIIGFKVGKAKNNKEKNRGEV